MAQLENTPRDIRDLESTVGYTFTLQNKKYGYEALKHSTYVSEQGQSRIESGERLEFLGDSVLSVIANTALFIWFPNDSTRELTNKHSSLVCTEALSAFARSISLGDYLYLGRGENMRGGRDSDSNLEDAFEALIGAIYLDSHENLQTVTDVVRPFLARGKHLRTEKAIASMEKIKGVEQVLDYRFRDKELGLLALRHPSYVHESHHCVCTNERLAFLGDALISLVVTTYIFKRFPKLDEGKLTRLRAKLICTPTLARFSERLGIGSLLWLGNNEKNDGGDKKDSNLENAFEALLAAMYLDSGKNFATVTRFLKPLIKEGISAILRVYAANDGDHTEKQ